MIEAMSQGAIDGNAFERQTGPGIRREEAIIRSQLESLQGHPAWQKSTKRPLPAFNTFTTTPIHDRPHPRQAENHTPPRL